MFNNQIIKLDSTIYKEHFILLSLLVLIIFTLYSPALDGPFLFDDTNNIEQYPAVHMKVLSFPALKKAALRPRPVAMLSFALDFYIHGLSPFWFRITNILIHICTALALYFLLTITINLIFPNPEAHKFHWLPGVSTILWAIHPLQIQSVTYIVQRMNCLAGLFLLLSLLFYILCRLSTSNMLKRGLLALSSLIFGILAVGSKPNAAMLPVLIILYEWIFFQQCNWKQIRRHIPFLLLSLLILLGLTWYFLGGDPIAKINSWYAKNNFTPIQRVMTEFRVVILYLSLLAFPHPTRLNIDHDILLSKSLTLPLSTGLSLATIIIILLVGIVLGRKLPLLTFGIFWFFINLLVESTLIPLDFIFEHRNYVPSMMLIPAAVFCLMHFFKKQAARTVLIVTFTLFSMWTYERNTVWQSGITLWQDSVEKSPSKPRPHESLAYYLEKEGRDYESLQHYLNVAKLTPDNPIAWNNVGNLYMKTGQFKAAANSYSAALRLRPDYKDAHNNIGNALSRQGRFKEAVEHYKKTLQFDEKSAKVHTNLANALAGQGNAREAMLHYDRALELASNNMEARYNRSILLLRLNRFAEAEQELLKVTQQRKNFKEGYNNLGVTQEHLGDIQKALENYQQALSIDPSFLDAQKNLQRLEKRRHM
ncbi:MAG: tetratricopeptide repeat protein [Candidatus Electrothrix scaldis]|nr:MAG: tetratricopeptide repeat protein [Candidatus Electrothrix sp. GW3-3]